GGGGGGGGGCRLQGTVGDAVEWMAVRLAMVGCEFVVESPEELVRCVRELGGRLSRAGA
ncbi:transcriptional regulator, partial [Streptomyces coerulescens]